MSLFGNSYEDAVYSQSYHKQHSKDWWEIPYKTTYIVDCNKLDSAELERLLTKLVNGEGAVDDEDIVIDDDSDNIIYFEITGEYSYNQTLHIDRKLDMFNVSYGVV